MKVVPSIIRGTNPIPLFSIFSWFYFYMYPLIHTFEDAADAPVIYEASSCFRRKAFQIGIVSRGSGCAYANKPAIFTRINYFYDWIIKHSNEDSGCETFV